MKKKQRRRYARPIELKFPVWIQLMRPDGTWADEMLMVPGTFETDAAIVRIVRPQ